MTIDPLIALLQRRPLTVAALSALPASDSDVMKPLGHTSLSKDALRVLIELGLVEVNEIPMGTRSSRHGPPVRRHRRYVRRSPLGDRLVQEVGRLLREANLARLPSQFRNATRAVYAEWQAFRKDLGSRRADYMSAVGRLSPTSLL